MTRFRHIFFCATSWVLTTIALAMPMVCASAQTKSEAAKRHIPNLPNYDRRPMHFGFLVGLNYLDYHVDNTGVATEANMSVPRYAEVLDLTPGINLAIVNDWRLCENLNLRLLPGISFGQRELSYRSDERYIDWDKIEQGGDKYVTFEMEKVILKSTYLDLPILLKYSAYRLGNIKPYVVGGTSLRYDLAKDKGSYVKTKPFGAYADFGAGMDFYLPYFRFSMELRASFGLSNIYADRQSAEPESTIYYQAISGLKSRWFGLSFYFE